MSAALIAVVPPWPKALGVALVLAALGAGLVPVATAEAAEPCPNEQLRQESNVNPATGRLYSSQLPDCRAYEQVSPAGPYNAEFNGVAPGGSTVFFASGGAVAGLPADVNNGFAAVRMFGVSRAADGWSLSSFTNFSDQVLHNYPFMGSSADGSRMFVSSATLETPESVLTNEIYAENLYETDSGGAPLLISHDQNGSGNVESDEHGLVGPVVVSGDGTHVAFSNGAPLTARATDSGGGPYVYESDASGNVSLVSVMSNGELPPGGPPGEVGAAVGGAKPGALYQGGRGVVTNAVSTDGSTVFFNSTEQYDSSAPSGTGRQVFMHREGATIDVSKGTENASFDGASSDGTKVVFSDGSNNVYEFDSTTRTLVLISSGARAPAGANPYVAMSTDGSHVYFASQLRLDPVAPPFQGEPFLYQWANGHVTYIATLSELDLSRLTSTRPAPSSGEGLNNVVLGTFALGPVRTTADGAHLVFESERRLTADDRNEEAGRINVYEYTDGKGLVRVSAGSVVGSGDGPYSSTIGSQQQLPDFASGAKGEQQPFTFGVSQTDGRVLAEDGSVFFSSREALADGATNGPLHVYAWKEGHTYLLSPPGPEATDAQYLENSPDGANVYFSTTQEVLASDTNGGWVNVWDARVDGGFPGPPPANPCAENECPVSPLAARGTPPSMTFSGPGNATPSPPGLTTQLDIAAKPMPLTRAQMLVKALKACKAKQHKQHERAACEQQAKRRYGRPKSKASKRGRRIG